MANEFDEVLDQESAGSLPPLSSGLEKGEFDDVLDTEVSQQRDYVRNVIDIASKDNPEAAAERVRLSQSTGLPPDVVARNQQELKRREIARAIDLQRMMRDSPVLFRQMTDPTFTAAAIDDLDTLRQIEKSFTNIADYAKSGEMASDAGGAARSLALGATVGVGKMIFDVFGAATDLVGLDYLAGGYRTMSDNAREAMDAFGMQADTSTGRAIKSGLESAGQNLALLPLGLERGLFQTAEAAGAAVAGAMSAGVGAASYQRARGEGVGRLNSALYGINDAGVEFLMEKIPAGQLFKGIELDNSLLKQFAQQTVTEGWTEQVTTIAQDFNEWMALHPEKSTAEFLAERPEAAYQTFIATLIGTGVQTTAIAGINKLVEKASDQALVYEQDRLKRQLQLAGMSALRERSPEQFRANMEQVIANAPEGAPTEIHVDAEVLNQLAPEMQALLPESVRAQIPDALAMNATVPISMADVLTIAPGTELEQILNDNARVGSPEAPSRVEAEKAAEFIQQDAERVLQQAQDQSAWQSEVDTVQQTIKDQLDQAGRFTSDVNEGYARLQSQFFSVMASRFGITPSEMYQRFSVKVAGQMGQGEVLNAEYDQNAIGGVLDGGRMGINVRSDTSAGVRYADELVDGRKQFETRDSDSLRAYVGKRIAIVRTGEGPAKAIGEVTLGEPRIVNEEEFRQLQAEHLVPEGSTFDVKPGGVKYLYPVSEPVRYGAEKDVGAGIVSRRVLGQPGAEFNQSALADDAVDEASDDAPSAMEQADVPASVDDAAALSSALRVATSSIWRKGRDLKVAIQNAVQAAARAAGVDVSVESPQSEAYLIRVGLRDALDALKQNANAVGWYDLKTRQALAVMSLVHPELAADEDARLAFVWIMAVTSNGLKVGKNFELAETAYRRYKQDGRMPTDVGVGNASKAINDSLGLFDTLKTQWGSENLRKFMLTPFLVEEISALSKDLTPGGEHADVEVRGAAILGPKIGNGFFSNLYGNFDALTMDRWLIRTWGRWSGTLIKDMPRHTAEARARVREVMAKIEANLAERDRLSALISHTFDTSTEAGLDAIALAVQKASMKPNLRAEMNKTEVGSELRLSGNGLAKYLDGQKEAPSGPWERKYIRRVFQGILAELKGQPEYANLTMADLQAVLWYAEKRLYEAAKTDLAAEDEVDGYEDDEAPDYANAAVDVARSAGVSERKIQNALKREENGGRSATARSADNEQTGSQGQPREAGGFTGREKREFRATVAIHRARRIRSALIGDERSPWTYTRRSGTDGPRVRVLKKLGIKYTEQWKAGTALARTLKNNGQKVPTFYELDSGSADKFRDAIAASKAASPFGAAVYVYPLEEYQGMRLFLSEEGAGFALKPDGDIVSVFGGGGTGHATMDLAITLGGRKLDCFDTVLPRIYSVHGFVPAARLTWDDSQAPEGWSKQTFGEYNDGEPDVLFMAYDPTSFAPYATEAGSRVSTYNGALRVQARAVRNGLGVAQPNLFEQQARGTFNPQTLLIALGPQSDLSTFLHESGHFFLEVMADLAAQPDAPAQVREDMGKVLGWFGVPDLATWQGYTLDQKREHHEKWAESFEQYLLEGKAPSAELQPLFRRFRAWLVNVYKSLTDFMRGRNLELNDEIRQVFDRMLATDEQIAQAEEQSGLLPDFDATNAAIERLQERSMRALKWTLNARSKFLKQFTKEARELRKGVLAEVMAEFEQRPDVMASRAIRKVRNKDGAERDAKIAAIADATGYPTVEEMTAAVTALGPVNEAVEAEVDRRMLERHGDMATQEALEAAANEAVHNEARARALAAELKSQDEAMNPRETTGRTDARGRPITVNALVEAARAFGADLAARRAVGKLKNAIYLHRAAEARAGKAWQTATKKGDSNAAVQAKKDQLLNNQAVRALIDAQNEVRSAIEFFRKVTKGNNEKLVKGGRDPDVVNAMRAILGAYGIAPRTGKTALEYMELVQKNDPAMYGVIAPGVNTALANAKPFSELTVEEVRGLTDELKSLWHLAKRSRQMEIDGDLLDLEDLADQLYARMEDIGIPDVLPGETGALTDAELRKRNWLQQAPAILRRVEQWAEAKDGAFGGPFLRFIFQPVKIAADRYRADRLVYRQKFQALVDAIAPTMAKSIIAAPELDYTFGRGHNGIGMAEVLHAILHTGNDSNKRKLLLGRNWATENPDGTLDTSRWDAFIARLITEGTLTKAHYDFAQGVWDLMEETKPLAQKTHRDVFGRYFAEVTANPVTTPFGTYRGGYVPAQADPLLVQDADQRELLETENAGMSYAFPATNKGFTKGRVEYNRPLKLDLRTLPQHIDKVLLFSHMEPAVRGVDRLLRRKKIAQALNKIDPAAINGMLKPWLNRSARQTVETPVSADAGMNRMLSQARARTGMALMMGNLSNTLQQITGFSTALLKVKGSHMRRAVAQYIADPQQLKNTVWSLSPYMADRASNEVAVLSDTLEAILLNPSVYQSAERFTRRHAYFLQTAMDNQMSPIIWTGAYNQALAEGMEDRMARRYADGVIRQTQGSTLPEDVSRIETGTAFARAFTQFVGYFNMLANTNATALQQIAQQQGLRKGAGKAFGVLMLGMMIPIWVAEVIAQAFRGGPEDDEDDGYLDDWLAAVFGFGTIRGILSGVPVIAQMGQSMVNRFNDNPADDKFSLSPTVSVLESAVAAPHSVYKAIFDEGSAQKAVRDMSALITLRTGLPAMTLARPLGYAAGVAQGKIEPTGPADFARGMVTGTASPESKNP